MTARKLAYSVLVDDKWYGPDSKKIPADVAKKIGDHAWIDADDEPADEVLVPPLSGKGSGDAAWRDYARSLTDPEVEVADDAKRDAIVEAIESAGLPVEPE